MSVSRSKSHHESGRSDRKAAHHRAPWLSPLKPISPLGVKVVESVIGIEGLEGRWREMTGPGAAPFQTFTWNLAWYRHFRDHYDQILVFTVEREGKIIGILPCYRKGGQIRLAGDNAGDYQDILVDSFGVVEEALEAIFNFVTETHPVFRFFFRKVSSRGHLYHYLEQSAPQHEEMIVFSRFFAPCPEVSISGGLENYLGSLPSKRRQDMRRSLRRFDRAMPAARVEMIRNLDIRVADLESVAKFHVIHFRKSGVSPMQDDSLLKMLGEVAKDPEVGLQLGALVDHGEMLAVDIGFACRGRYYGYLTGFHPEYRKFAPGKCLLLKRIDAWVNEDGIKMLDFLSGDEPYKNGFTHGESYQVRSFHWMPNRMGCRARRATLVAGQFGRRVVKETISKIALPR